MYTSTSDSFKEYYNEEKIHLLIAMRIPQDNGLVEKVNRTLISLFTKLSDPKHENWFKFLIIAQKYLNAKSSRSTGRSTVNTFLNTFVLILSL